MRKAVRLTARGSAVGMALGTLMSRLTGLMRTAAIAAALGVTTLGDAWNAASVVPTMLLVLVTGGTLSAVLVPLLARHQGARQRDVAEHVGGLILTATAAATAVAIMLAPLLARLLAIRVDDPAQRSAFVSVTTILLIVLAPQVLAYGVSVWATATLNANGKLALAGFAPVVTNVVTLAAVVGYTVLASGSHDLQTVPTAGLAVLGLGSSIGVAVMAGVQYAGARRLHVGLRLAPRWPRRADPLTRHVLALGRWTVVYVGVNQAGLLAVTVLAAGIGSGGAFAAYQWAFTIMQLPYAVIAVSVLSTLYPRLARSDGAQFSSLSAEGLRITVALLTPAAIGLGLLARPASEVLLGYGAAQGGVSLIAAALRVFAAALVPFTVFQVIVRSHYARGDTRTPALVNVVVNTVNIGFGVAAVYLPLAPSWRLSGLVGAYALSYVCGCALLGRSLALQIPGAFAGLSATIVRALVASAALAVAVVAADGTLPSVTGPGLLAGRTGALVLAGGAAWLFIGLIGGEPELRRLLAGRTRRQNHHP